MNAASGLCSVGGGSPLFADNEFRVPLYTEQFAADPHTVYTRMREQFGSLAPVWLAPGVPATLVIGYWTALEILNDPEHFPADPHMDRSRFCGHGVESRAIAREFMDGFDAA